MPNDDLDLNQSEALNVQKALEMLDGDKELLNEILKIFMNDAPKRIEQISLALADGNMDEIKTTAHTLKGSAAAVGAERIRAVSLEIEGCALKNDRGSIGVLVDDLKNELNLLIKVCDKNSE